MIFDTYANKTLPSLMLIHGMANTAQSCYGRIVPLLDEYHVILCEVDGHTDKEAGLFISLDKGNLGIVNTFYKNIEIQSIKNACRDIYRYEISGEISDFSGEVTFWHGSNESYPEKTAKLLKRYLPQMQVEVFEEMGHGQFLNEHPEEYACKMKKIFS